MIFLSLFSVPKWNDSFVCHSIYAISINATPYHICLNPLYSPVRISPTIFNSCPPEAWGSVLSLKLLCFDELFAVIIDPAVYKETDVLLLSRAPIWLFEWRPTPWPDTQLLASIGPAQMDGFAITHTSQQPFLHYWKLPPIVPKAEFNLQFPQ